MVLALSKPVCLFSFLRAHGKKAWSEKKPPSFSKGCVIFTAIKVYLAEFAKHCAQLGSAVWILKHSFATLWHTASEVAGAVLPPHWFRWELAKPRGYNRDIRANSTATSTAIAWWWPTYPRQYPSNQVLPETLSPWRRKKRRMRKDE